MSEDEARSIASEPVTPRGVAAFARASSGRLFVVQFIVALAVALATAWFLADAWFPIVTAAIQQLPDEGKIQGGRFDWRGGAPQLLAEGTFLSFGVDLDHSGDVRSPAHVEVELGRDDIFIRSILGYATVPYPKSRVVVFNREELRPWWGAWRPMYLALAALGVLVYLLVTWTLLAAVYALPLWLLMFLTNRGLKLSECWRLAGAALLPGALLMVAGILLYDFCVVDLVGLGFIAAGHLVLGWIYLFISPLFLPPVQMDAARQKNPFARKET